MTGQQRANEPRQVVYVSASSGGGHDGAAKAMTALCQAEFGPALEQRTLDFYGGGLLQKLPVLARIRYRSDVIWRAFLALTDRRSVVRLLAALLRPFGVRWLRQRIPSAPDVLVAVHFGAAQCLDALAGRFRVRPRTAIVVTDYEAHWAWVAKADLYVVASARAEARLTEASIPAHKILRLSLLPSRSPESDAEPDARVRDGKVRIVAFAGQDGTSAPRLARALARLDAAPQAVNAVVDVICGHGEELRQVMEQLAQRCERLEVRVHGFLRDVPARLAAADIALVRAGAQSVTEALAAAKPVVIFDWHVHEEANARFVEELGCGVASRETDVVVSELVRLIGDTEHLQRVRERARRVAQGAPDRAFARELLSRLMDTRHDDLQGAALLAAVSS